MVRNLSFKADDDFDDRLYSVSKKKGMTKSAFIKEEIGKIIKNENLVNSSTEISNRTLNVDSEKENENNPVWSAFNKPEIKNEIKSELKKEEKLSEIKQEIISEIKSSEIKIPETKVDINSNPKSEVKSEIKSDIKIGNKNKLIKYVIKRGNNMSGELKSIDVESEINKVLNRKKFDENIREIHERIRKIDDRVCTDGDCFKKDLKEVREHLNQVPKLNDILELKKEIKEIKKDSVELDICPTCGGKHVVPLSSYCSNCGTEFEEWSDKDGKKIEGWKPYKLRVGNK